RSSHLVKFDGETSVPQYGCFGFKTRVFGKKSGYKSVELMSGRRGKWPRDWQEHWFYAEVPGEADDEGNVSYPLASHPVVMRVVYAPPFEASGLFERCCDAFCTAAKLSSGRDIAEEFIAACIWPIRDGWEVSRFVNNKLKNVRVSFKSPIFGVKKPAGLTDKQYVGYVEQTASVICGPFTGLERQACADVLLLTKRMNRVFEEMKVKYGPHEIQVVKKGRKKKDELIVGATFVEKKGWEAVEKAARSARKGRAPIRRKEATGAKGKTVKNSGKGVTFGDGGQATAPKPVEKTIASEKRNSGGEEILELHAENERAECSVRKVMGSSKSAEKAKRRVLRKANESLVRPAASCSVAPVRESTDTSAGLAATSGLAHEALVREECSRRRKLMASGFDDSETEELLEDNPDEQSAAACALEGVDELGNVDILSVASGEKVHLTAKTGCFALLDLLEKKGCQHFPDFGRGSYSEANFGMVDTDNDSKSVRVVLSRFMRCYWRVHGVPACRRIAERKFEEMRLKLQGSSDADGSKDAPAPKRPPPAPIEEPLAKAARVEGSGSADNSSAKAPLVLKTQGKEADVTVSEGIDDKE
ncbi:hypothetical protein EJB05_13892, partial [Eragrostis curvula]